MQPTFPEPTPTQQIERLLIERAKLKRAQRSPYTTRGYANDWKHFAAWCTYVGREALPSSEDTLSLYITYLLTEGKKVTSASRFASAVAYMHSEQGMPSPFTKEVRGILSGARRIRCEQLRHMTPITLDQVRQIARALTAEGTKLAIRNKAVLLVGFASALRRINLAALNTDDIEWCEHGILIRVIREKQDQEGKGRTIAVPRGKDKLSCPVRALEAWIGLRGKEPGPLFTRLDGPPNARLSLQAIWVIVKRSISAIGLEGDKYGPHSLRAGLITEAGMAGVNPLVIAEQSGHRSLDSLKRYYRPVNQFTVNAAALIGL
jgi:integrase